MALGATLTIFWWFCRYIKEEAKPPFDDIKGFFFRYGTSSHDRKKHALGGVL